MKTEEHIKECESVEDIMLKDSTKHFHMIVLGMISVSTLTMPFILDDMSRFICSIYLFITIWVSCIIANNKNPISMLYRSICIYLYAISSFLALIASLSMGVIMMIVSILAFIIIIPLTIITRVTSKVLS